MKKVEKFESLDGHLFNTEKECRHYENRKGLLDWIEKNIEYSEDEGIDEEDIANAIMADIEALVKFTNGIHENQPDKVKKSKR